jgi:hypothetical protein
MKFSLRDLFLVTVIVALVLGWDVDHWRTASERMEQWQLRARLLQVMFEDEGYAVSVEGTWPYRSLIVKRHDVEMRSTLYSQSVPYTRHKLDSPVPASQAPAPNP